jgi:hypothetical protein
VLLIKKALTVHEVPFFNKTTESCGRTGHLQSAIGKIARLKGGSVPRLLSADQAREKESQVHNQLTEIARARRV